MFSIVLYMLECEVSDKEIYGPDRDILKSLPLIPMTNVYRRAIDAARQTIRAKVNAMIPITFHLLVNLEPPLEKKTPGRIPLEYFSSPPR